jgi:hypothetical protein
MADWQPSGATTNILLYFFEAVVFYAVSQYLVSIIKHYQAFYNSKPDSPK